MNWLRTNNRQAFIPRVPGTMQSFGLPTPDIAANKLYIYSIESDRRHTDWENDNIAGRWFKIWRYSISFADLQTWKPDAAALNINVSLAIEGMLNNFSQHNITDTVSLLIRNNAAPFETIDSIKAPVDPVTLQASFPSYLLTSGSYFLILKGRNTLETWSKFPVQIMGTQTVNYDFTSYATQAFGNNLILKNGKFCIYSGDVDQNGVIELRDIMIVSNDETNSVTGYVSSDVNGDMVVNLNDILITYNNVNRFVRVLQP